MLTSSSSPGLYKRSKVFPVHKKSSKYEFKDHRGVHVLPALSKALEKVMKYQQIASHLNFRNLLCRFQTGYRSKYSTTTYYGSAKGYSRCKSEPSRAGCW